MKITYRRRKSGKTTEMIHWVMSNKANVLIVMDERRVTQLEKQFPELSGTNQIMTMRSYVYRAPAFQKDTHVSIDDAELVLSNYLRHPIVNISMSK